jgi:hypothetical protein
MLETNNYEAVLNGTQMVRQPGELFWMQTDSSAQPLRVLSGVVAYRRGAIAVGILGPGSCVFPIPGIGLPGAPICDLVAVTETAAQLLGDGWSSLSVQQLSESANAVVTGADRLGNMSLPRRLAALLLDITAMTGQSVVGCRQDILAMAASARRETVATILSGWRDEDWIQTRYRRTKVVDRVALIQIRDAAEGTAGEAWGPNRRRRSLAVA